MQVTLIYFDHNHRPLGKELDAGQRVLFGQGDRADFPVSGENVAAVHFAIENDGALVWVHRLADAMAPVLVNEQPVEKCEINDGDTVSAGNTKVRVQIRGRQRGRAAARDEPPPPTESQTLKIVAETLPTGLVKYHDPQGGTPAATVLEKVLMRSAPLLIANFRLAGQPQPDWLDAESDLLSAAPAQVTDEHSLHFISAADVPRPLDGEPPLDAPNSLNGPLIEMYHTLRPHAAAVLALTTATKEEVLEASRFRRGFYCTADGLEMFLTQGSRELARALVERLQAIFIARASDTSWALYANPKLAPTAADLGLEAQLAEAAAERPEEATTDSLSA